MDELLDRLIWVPTRIGRTQLVLKSSVSPTRARQILDAFGFYSTVLPKDGVVQLRDGLTLRGEGRRVYVLIEEF